jgi:hypothetical protein
METQLRQRSYEPAGPATGLFANGQPGAVLATAQTRFREINDLIDRRMRNDAVRQQRQRRQATAE